MLALVLLAFFFLFLLRFFESNFSTMFYFSIISLEIRKQNIHDCYPKSGHTASDIRIYGHTDVSNIAASMETEYLSWRSNGNWGMDHLQGYKEILSMLWWLVWRTLPTYAYIQFSYENSKKYRENLHVYIYNKNGNRASLYFTG